MGIASRTPVAVYIADIEDEGPDILNIEFERKDYGHTAFIHAPAYDGDDFVGILEPCTFGDPHVWTEEDKSLTAAVQDRLGPVAGRFVHAEPR
jgi:GAF domain-containing protein